MKAHVVFAIPRRLPTRCFIFAASLLVLATTARSAPLDEPATLALLVRTIDQADDDSVRAALLKGMLRGLEGRRNVGAPAGWKELGAELAASDSPTMRDLGNRLSQIFGDREAIKKALATLKNTSAPIEARQNALGSLVAQQYAELAPSLKALLKEPELRLPVVRAFAVLPTKDAPGILIGLYAEESPELRRAIVETLATRKEFARALVGAIKSEQIDRKEIPSYVARSLRNILGKDFTDVYGEIQELNENVSETIAKYKKLVSEEELEKADASRGRNVFQKTCGACHLMYGVGGKVGPDLTGSNRANLDYLLLNSVAPSADVPEGYRTQLVQTVDGRLLTGVLAEEDNQRIVLKTVDQPRVVIAKSDIEARKVSPKSMMPEGQLDQLSKRELFDLIKYMQTKTQVEAAQ